MGPNKYKEHWRHIQYDTDRAMAQQFFTGHEFSQYLDAGGRPFKEDIFYQCKCECIEQSKFEECSCPTCTIARETVRDWDRQRPSWFTEADGDCPCGGHCSAGSDYRKASRSFAALRAFLHAPCGKVSLDELKIAQGPKSCEKVEMYRRQCCRGRGAEQCGGYRAGDEAPATQSPAPDPSAGGWAGAYFGGGAAL